jgi:hypothetical protein
MPIGPAHIKQRRKNLLLLAILLGFAALFFSITVLRITG